MLLPILPLISGCTALDGWLDPGPEGLVVSVLYFDNRTPDPALDVLGKGLADMMITDLSRVQGITVVERARLQDLLDELELQRTGWFDPATAQRIGEMLGATHTVTGAVHKWAPQLRIDVRLVDVSDASVQLSDSVTGPEDQFFELQQSLSDKFVAALDQPPAPIPEDSRVPTADGVLDYSRSLEALDEGDLASAYALLQQLTARMPDFGLAQQRQDDVGRRLDEARARREALLNEEQRVLLANADRALAQDIETVGERTGKRYFAYRHVRGALFAQAAEGLVRKGLMGPNHTVARKDRDAFVEMMRIYANNQVTLVRELIRYRQRVGRAPLSMSLPDEDAMRAEAVGARILGLPLRPDEVAGRLADWVCVGKRSHVSFAMSPTAAELSPRIGEVTLEGLEASLGALSGFYSKRVVDRQVIRTSAHAGECLLALDRPAEAIERLQPVLDAYPTHPEYDRVEAVIERAR